MDLDFIMSSNFRRILNIELLKETEYIFEQNFHELVKLLDDPHHDNHELKRSLHNFLTANTTLIAHTKRLMKYCPEIKDKYNYKMEHEFKDSLLNNFMKDLRNYLIHFSLPMAIRKVIKKKDKIILSDKILHKDMLLQWEGWNTFSKLFLTELKSDVVEKDLFLEHYHKVVDLYSWLEKLMQEAYTDDFKRYNDNMAVIYNQIKIEQSHSPQ